MPFYLRTGKRLGRRVTEIAVVFKRAPHLPFDKTMTEELGQNALVIRVQPDEGITMRFGSKVPGSEMEVRDVNMDFSYGQAFTVSSPEAYERLILDVLLGVPSLFPVDEEVELSWKILDPVLEHWAANGRPEPYESGTWVRNRPTRCCGVPAGNGASVRLQLRNTSANAISRKLVELRRSSGMVTQGRVLTFIVCAGDARGLDAAITAATEASKEHPCRVIVVGRGRQDGPSRLDAEIRVAVKRVPPRH